MYSLYYYTLSTILIRYVERGSRRRTRTSTALLDECELRSASKMSDEELPGGQRGNFNIACNMIAPRTLQPDDGRPTFDSEVPPTRLDPMGDRQLMNRHGGLLETKRLGIDAATSSAEDDYLMIPIVSTQKHYDPASVSASDCGLTKTGAANKLDIADQFLVRQSSIRSGPG